MMNLKSLFFYFFLFIPFSLFAAEWFGRSDSLTSAHQYLLEGNPRKSVLSMIEAWQQETNDKLHLERLLSVAIGVDCGQSLNTNPFPHWLKTLTFRRESVQTSNRIYYAISIYGHTNNGIADLSLSAWPDKEFHFNVINEKKKTAHKKDFKYTLEGLSQNISAGLYKLSIKPNDGRVWSTWLLISQADPIQQISWRDSKNWRISLNKKYMNICPKPALGMHLYQQQNSQLLPVWSLEKDTSLPTTLPLIKVPAGAYWFNVSLIERRWQGSILFENIQGIGRSMNFPLLNSNIPSVTQSWSEEQK